ncbi:MAG TPA: hypothetical protein VF286_07885, partial [Acidiphilium sp.]
MKPGLSPELFELPGGVLPVFSTGDWRRGDPALRCAAVVVHGRGRNADVYRDVMAASARKARADCLILAPHFPNEEDAPPHGFAPEMLRWNGTGWMGGDAAIAPAPVSSFAVLDAILARLADRARFPALERILVVGHSGGGQVVQRHAILTGMDDRLRFIVANPSSYAYFSRDRWKYGMEGRPDFGTAWPVAELEARYVARDVVYLLGQADCDPDHPALDRSPPAMAQGENRLERGRNYV